MNVGERVTLQPPPLGLTGSLAIYGLGAALLYVATRILIPSIVRHTGVEPVVAWFIAAGCAVFLPLIVVASLLLAAEQGTRSQPIGDRLWIHRLSPEDWRSTLGGAVVIALLSTPLVIFLIYAYGKDAFTPAFLAMEPLHPGRYWILAVWLPFFLVNILGEAFVWHAVMLPRQVESFGRLTWVVSGSGWMLFHIALPWQILLSLTPTMFVIPYLIQRRQNVWVGAILHSIVNGSGFIAVAFGSG